MQTFTIRDLRDRTGDLVRDAEAGKLSIVTKHGQPVFVAVPFDEDLVQEGVRTALAIKLFESDVVYLRQGAKMYAMRFGEEPPQRRSVEQLRGIEGARVREMYKRFAVKYGVQWRARNYDVDAWDASDLPNRCLSAATASLYGVTEAAVLAAGYAPAVGFIHTGKPLSFVYDVADVFKFETVVPVAFQVAAKKVGNPEREVRLKCRDVFRQTRLLERIIPTIEEMLAAGEIAPPEAAPEQVGPSIPEPKPLGDAGHRG